MSITADTAETCRIPDGGTGVSVDEVWIMLKDLGADQRYASKGYGHGDLLTFRSLELRI